MIEFCDGESVGPATLLRRVCRLSNVLATCGVAFRFYSWRLTTIWRTRSADCWRAVFRSGRRRRIRQFRYRWRGYPFSSKQLANHDQRSQQLHTVPPSWFCWGTPATPITRAPEGSAVQPNVRHLTRPPVEPRRSGWHHGRRSCGTGGLRLEARFRIPILRDSSQSASGR